VSAPPILSNSALRRAPARRALAALCAAIQPGSRVGAVRRLRGGISRGMHAVDVVGADGERHQVVVQRYNAHHLREDPRVAEREWSVLVALGRVGAPTPRPIWIDRDGAIFGGPTIVTSRLPGRGLLAPRDAAGWIRQLAEALGQIHRAPLSDAELESLIDQGAALARLLDREAPPPDLTTQPGGPDAWSAMRRWWPHLESSAPTLLHGDYWPGNTLWRYGRLTGVVDWEQAGRGNPDQDVAYCRLDLALLAGPEAPEAFRVAYEAATGRVVRDLFFWDLNVVAWALGDVDKYVAGYHDLGRRDITVEDARDRLAGFAADALARADSALGET